MPGYHLGMNHVERVIMTEMGTVMVVRDAAIVVAVVATVLSNPLRLRSLCLMLLRLLWALRLRSLRMLLLRLSCALGLRSLRMLLLCLLCALGLCFLCLLRLRLLCFSSAASAFFLMFLLCKCRNADSEK